MRPLVARISRESHKTTQDIRQRGANSLARCRIHAPQRNGTHRCPRALATLTEVERDLWYKRAAASSGPRLASPAVHRRWESREWPARALLGSQPGQVDAMKTAYRLGRAPTHMPLEEPVSWAEDHFGLGRSGEQAGRGCTRAESRSGVVDRAAFYLPYTPGCEGSQRPGTTAAGAAAGLARVPRTCAGGRAPAPRRPSEAGFGPEQVGGCPASTTRKYCPPAGLG